jgi:hypothetical protein
MKIFKTFILWILFVSILGCATTPQLDEQKDDKKSLLFGYFKSGEKDKLEEVNIAKLPGPLTNMIVVNMEESGFFYAENIDPGKYQIMNFKYMSPQMLGVFIEVSYIFSIIADGSKPIEVEPGKIVFLGSYQLGKGKQFTPLINFGDVQGLKLDSPTEKELLEQLLIYGEKTKWKALIQKRINKLK